MDGRAKEAGRRENKHTVEMERGDGRSGTENGQRKELKCAFHLWIQIWGVTLEQRCSTGGLGLRNCL